MAEYLTGTHLRERILKVMAGRRPKMCVAFLGPNWVDEVFAGALPPKAKVICDLRMGATVRAALEAGGAPNNERLRHLAACEMHAKVYLSDKGAVVGSANATRAALTGANRIEDGIWVKAGSATHRKICKRFKGRYEAAEHVDQAALDAAPIRVGGPGLPPGLTLVEALRFNPDAFHGIYFVCSTENVDRAVRDAADRRIAEEEDEADPAGTILHPGRREHFASWDTSPADWPALFFSVHRGPRGGFSLSKNDSPKFYEGVQGADGGDPKDVFVSRRRDWVAAGPAFGGLPRLASHSACRDELRAIFPTEDSFEPLKGGIFTGAEFVECLPISEHFAIPAR